MLILQCEGPSLGPGVQEAPASTSAVQRHPASSPCCTGGPSLRPSVRQDRVPSRARAAPPQRPLRGPRLPRGRARLPVPLWASEPAQELRARSHWEGTGSGRGLEAVGGHTHPLPVPAAGVALGSWVPDPEVRVPAPLQPCAPPAGAALSNSALTPARKPHWSPSCARIGCGPRGVNARAH